MAARIIPGDRVKDWQAWDLGSFDEAPRRLRPLQPPADAPPEVTEAEPPAEEDVNLSHVPYPTADELERIHQEAWQGGFDAGQKEGHDKGYAEGRRQAEAEAAALTALLASAREALNALDRELAGQMLRLSGRIASEVLREAVAVKPEVVQAVLREVLSELPEGEARIRVRCHPEDLALLRRHQGTEGSAGPGLVFEEDADIARGGLRVSSDLVDVDATLQERWQRMADALGLDPGWL